MTLTRRAAFVVALGALLPMPAAALSQDVAKDHVRQTVEEVLALVRGPGSTAEKARAFRGILERRVAMPQVARFVAGPRWREMSGDQQNRFADAFTAFVSRTYARRFGDYSGQEIALGRVVDAGRRGLLVQSRVVGGGSEPITVEWLVSDRPGRTVIADIVIENVSLLITQRDEVAALFERNRGDVERVIETLASA